MTVKWKEMGEKRLDPEDKVQVSYEVRFNEKSGWLMMSNKKLMFVEEKGLLFRTYNFVKEIPYEKIDDITFERKLYEIGLTEIDGDKHHITSRNAFSVVSRLKDLMQSALPQVST